MLAALTGCVGVAKRPAPQLDGATAGTAPELPTWWKSLGDFQLTKWGNQALDRNPDLKVLSANIQEARELARAQKARGLPAADLSAGWRHGRRSDRETNFRNIDVDPWQATSEVTWEIDLFGRIAARRSAAAAKVEERTADWYGGQLLLSADTASACLTQLRLNEERHIVAELEAASSGIAKTLRDRQDAGLASDVEAGRQEAETETLHRAVLEIDRQRAIAAARLDSLLGQPPGTSKPPAGELSSRMRLPKLPNQIPAGTVRNRPDLLSAEAAVREAYSEEQADRLDLYPNLQLRFDGLAATGMLTGPVTTWLAAGGPRLSFPALDPVKRAQARATQARTDAAVAEWERALLDAFEELETAAIDFHSHRRQLTSARREADQLRNVWNQTRENFDAGIVSHLEVLEDQRRYLAARRSELALYHQVLLDYVDLVKAAGGGLQ